MNRTGFARDNLVDSLNLLASNALTDEERRLRRRRFRRYSGGRAGPLRPLNRPVLSASRKNNAKRMAALLVDGIDVSVHEDMI